MIATIHELRPVENAVDPELVKLVEDFLDRVRRGEILDVAIVAHHRGGAVGDSSYVSPEGNGAYLIAGIERLKFRMLMDNV